MLHFLHFPTVRVDNNQTHQGVRMMKAGREDLGLYPGRTRVTAVLRGPLRAVDRWKSGQESQRHIAELAEGKTHR